MRGWQAAHVARHTTTPKWGLFEGPGTEPVLQQLGPARPAGRLRGRRTPMRAKPRARGHPTAVLPPSPPRPPTPIQVPPLMVIETTGEGRARFNPNLYAGAPGRRARGRGCLGGGPGPRAGGNGTRGPAATQQNSGSAALTQATPAANPAPQPDGKVCLSLLGTFHGANAAEKWSPKDSSLYQILLSVQGLILIEVGGGGGGASS
jgi:hypothetical protein